MRWPSLFLSVLVLFFSCTPDNVKQDNSLKKYFDENNVTGCFALFNNGSGKFTVYNLLRYRDSSFAPGATFDIVNSLVGLQTGKISNDSMVIKWDGIKRNVEEWNKDLTMHEAFRISAIPYYQEVARRIGKDTMQSWLDTLGYGTKKITGSIDTFWLDNTIKIKPDEELGLVKRLYFGQLPFYKYNQEIVKKAMQVESNSNYKISFITGHYLNDKGNNIGWITGWIEENQHPYFFVLNIQASGLQSDISGIRIRLLKDILKHLGFMEGKM
ncbi:MAG: class D beta-lactamase [Sphingobacteriales bacterium UTBCD1]|jgi:beta-lactamase class D|nr:MAG: class D beta-lactamase [Sphingobacteriales bacterium UTBCD1]